MANPEHLAKLKEGVEAWNKWRDENPRVTPDLREANLSEANLSRADLSGADLSRANLSQAILSETYLTGANLALADLIRANLSEANLSRADLTGADLSRANLSQANLSEAKLSWANLSRADLSEANLEDANLCSARNVVFDGNDHTQTHLNWRTTGPWLTLRRKYTGARLFFHILLLVAFVLPYVARTFFWVGLHKGQVVVAERLAFLEDSLGGDIEVLVTYHPDPNSLSVALGAKADTKPVKLRLSALFEQTKAKFREVSVWQVVLGFDKGIWYALTAGLLVSYNSLRLLMTSIVSEMSDEQNRTGHAPPRSSYIWLVGPHRIMKALFFFAVSSFLYHFWSWMTAPVLLPNF